MILASLQYLKKLYAICLSVDVLDQQVMVAWFKQGIRRTNCHRNWWQIMQIIKCYATHTHLHHTQLITIGFNVLESWAVLVRHVIDSHMEEKQVDLRMQHHFANFKGNLCILWNHRTLLDFWILSNYGSISLDWCIRFRDLLLKCPRRWHASLMLRLTLLSF